MSTKGQVHSPYFCQKTMKLSQAIINTFIQFQNIKGKTGKREFFLFFFFRWLVIYAFFLPGLFLVMKSIIKELRTEVVSQTFSQAAPLGTPLLMVGCFLMFIFFLPFLSLRFRRLNDMGKSHLWLLLYLIPIIGAWIFIFICKGEHREINTTKSV